MNYRILSLIIIVLSVFNLSCNKPSPKELRVMSFNIWVGGRKSVNATANVIVKSNADIIGIQESSRDGKNIAVHIADSLGWHSYATANSPAIISKYPIIDTSRLGNGVKIKIDDKRAVWMFNIHLMYCPYEPYQLNGIEYCGAPLLSTAEEAVNSAWQTRGKEVEAIISEILEAQKENIPVFLTGDFNEPSCLDWTARAAKAGLHITEVAWPATKAFQERAQMKDSYRAIYSDEVKYPGYTWTSLPVHEGQKEVLDRIDFVFYSGRHIDLINTLILGEDSPACDVKFLDYPSDHRAVIGIFKLQ